MASRRSGYVRLRDLDPATRRRVNTAAQQQQATTRKVPTAPRPPAEYLGRDLGRYRCEVCHRTGIGFIAAERHVLREHGGGRISIVLP